MAGVQRTRIGYGNEGRTEQLAASLSDFIRLFSLYYPAFPQQHNTTHQISCYARLTGRAGGSATGTSGSFILSPLTERTYSHGLKGHSRVLFEVSLIYSTVNFVIPLLAHNFRELLLIQPDTRAWLTLSTFSRARKLCVFRG